jgi:hypothetical protein
MRTHGLPGGLADPQVSPCRTVKLWVHRPQRVATFSELIDVETDMGWWGEVRLVSRQGLTLLLRRWLPIGTPLVLEVPCGLSGITQPVKVAVVDVMPHSGDRFALTCTYQQILAEIEWQFLSGRAR